MSDDLDVVVLDTETTGLKVGYDELLQVSILNGKGETAYYGYPWTQEEQHNSLEDCRATLFCYRQMKIHSEE